MPTKWTSLYVLLSALWAARAVAAQDDWVVALPGCALATGSRPELALLYPRSGLPAVVEAGGVLAARVRVVSALTPPPGIQQERALAGWSAQLMGAGISLGNEAEWWHRHSLCVISVRPDAGASLVYRVRLQVAAYVAPGTYALTLRTPFGVLTLASSVRVLAHGESVRLAPWQAAAAEADPASLPVDIWLSDDAAPTARAAALPVAESTHALQPVLVQDSSALALQVGSELWVRGSCPDDAEAFAAEAAAAAHAAGLSLRAWPEGAESSQSSLPPSAAGSVQAGLAEAAKLWQRTPRSFRVDNRASPRTREFSLLLPAGAGLQLSGGTLELFAASDLAVRNLVAIAGRLRVPARASVQLELTGLAATPACSLVPERVDSGVLTTIQVLGVPSGARVAFDYGSGRSALGGAQLEAGFPGPLGQPLRALVLPQEGGAQLVRRQLLVEPRRPPSCHAAQARAAPPGPSTLLLAWAFLLKRRRSRGFGNRLRPELRCEQRDRVPHATPGSSSRGLRAAERGVRAVVDPEHARA